MRKFLCIILLAWLSGCVPVLVKPPAYRSLGTVDGVEVRLYSTRRDFMVGIPAHVASFSISINRISPGEAVGAHYNRHDKIIHLSAPSADPSVAFVHELKHHLESSWWHGYTSAPEDQGWRQVGPNKIFILRGREFPVRDGETVESVMVKLREFLR